MTVTITDQSGVGGRIDYRIVRSIHLFDREEQAICLMIDVLVINESEKINFI